MIAEVKDRTRTIRATDRALCSFGHRATQSIILLLQAHSRSQLSGIGLT